MRAADHVLIVDDDAEIRSLLTEYFERNGFRASAVADGRAMRAALKTAHPDLVILDLMLPGEDGLALCRDLRTRSNVPILMLTARGEETDRIVGLEMGADDVLRGIDDEEPAQPFDVMAMLESVQADLTEIGADMTIEGGAEHAYTGQRRALRRCFANLVDKAIRYGGTAQIVVRDAFDGLAIAVRDEGPGIAPNEMEKVFEPFYRIEDSRSRTTGGTGLGLAIARQSARTHGGDVTLINRPRGAPEAQLRLQRSRRRQTSPAGANLRARRANRHP